MTRPATGGGDPLPPSWGRYAVPAAQHAKEVARRYPGVPVVAGTGLVYPTLAGETLAARASLRLEDLIPLALRRWRRQEGFSQRAAAEALGVAPTRMARAEADPGSSKLGAVLALLRAAGYDLQVVTADGTPLQASDIDPGELLARAADGRRLRATGTATRITNEPRWMAERGVIYQATGPQWTSERNPGRYP